MHRFAPLYAVARQYLNAVLLVGGGIALAVTPASYVWVTIALWAGLAGAIMAVAHYKTRSVALKYGGVLREFVPTPMDSVFGLLAKYDAPPSLIESITLMSTELSESVGYLFKNSGPQSFSSIMHRNPQIRMTMYGACEHGIPAVPDSEIRIDFKRTPAEYTEHTNLFTTKDGRAFIWYEPYHLVAKGRHYFTRGGYLSSDERRKLESEFYPALMSKAEL